MAELKEDIKNNINVNHELRYDALYKFVKLLVKDDKYNQSMDDLLKYSELCEKSIYEKCMNHVDEIDKTWESNTFIDTYTDEIRHILTNFDKNSHVINKDIPDLLTKMNISDLCKLSNTELYPTIWEPIFKDMREQEKAKERSAVNSGIKCKRCGSTDIFVSQSQTRSADEGSTIMTTCNNCGLVKKSGG